MKEKVLYTCEVCHTDYADKAGAEMCERNHKRKLKIVDKRYLTRAQDKSGFPITITIQSEDGTQVKYSR